MSVFNVDAIDELVRQLRIWHCFSVAVAAAVLPPLALATYEAHPAPCTKSTAEVKIYPSRLIQ